MNDHRPTDLELAAALRAHLPATAGADLRDRINLATAMAPQQRALPSVLGALTDADPTVRQRALLMVAAVLVAVALAGVAVVGALRQVERPVLPTGGSGLLAFTRQGDLYLANPDGSDAVPVLRTDAGLMNPRWSSDGRLIAIETSEPAIITYEVESGEYRRLTGGSFGGWSHDGLSLAYFTPNGEIAIVDVETGEHRTLVAPPEGTEGYQANFAGWDREPVTWSPDGRWLVADGPPVVPLKLVLIDTASGAKRVLATNDNEYPYATDWSPDSSRIVYAFDAIDAFDVEEIATLRMWVTNVDGSSTSEIVEPGAVVMDPDWSPDGEWIAYRSLRPEAGQSGQLKIVRPDGSDAHPIAEGVIEIVGWSEDGASVAYAAGTDASGESELHFVTITDGIDRLVSLPGGSRAFTWAPSVESQSGVAAAPSLPAAIGSPAPDTPNTEPAAGQPAQPDASWGGIAFRTQVDDVDCHLAVLRFPDQLTVLSPERAEPGAEASGPHPVTSCGFTFAKDGSAFVRAPWQGESFDVVRLDGTSHSIPFAGEVSSWSPGGGWLANIRCDRNQNCRTTIMRPDGSDRRELEGEPVWSADDRVLAVVRPDVMLVGNGDGTDLREIGAFPRPGGWSPDGSTFVFVRDGNAWLSEADGSSLRNLSEFPDGGVTEASWSPDGNWIAVLQGSTVWMFSPDGSVRQRLSEDPLHGYANWGPEWVHQWSPDGEWVALEQESQVTLFHAGDWRGVRLENAFQPAWSLDGRHLAVVADVNGQYQVDVMNPDGTGRVTVTKAISHPPVTWLP